MIMITMKHLQMNLISGLNNPLGVSVPLNEKNVSNNFKSDNEESKNWFGLVLCHINHCWLFNAKSSLYLYIKYIWFGLDGFYGISTIVGYLMPNSDHTYILNIIDLVWLVFMAYQPL